MSPIIIAELSNSLHPEHGEITVSFPIPRNEYDGIIRKLGEMGLGDVLKRDCRLDKIDSRYPILKYLEKAAVNLDELDYLAKRLDSFCSNEDAQFQGMAEKLKLREMTDFINLTFCCQQSTVITDFSDLESAGKDHLMTLNGGHMLTEEYNAANGRQAALDLLLNHDGCITPYGVVYANGMKLEQLYDGRHFPCYLYDASQLIIGITSTKVPEEEPKDWLYLPASQGQIDRTLARAEIASPEEAVLSLLDGFLSVEVNRSLSYDRESLKDLNDLCAAVLQLENRERAKLDAAVILMEPKSAYQIQQIAENLDLFEFVPGIKTPAEYGRYMIRESGYFAYDPNLEPFYNYDEYGVERLNGDKGMFTDQGYISCQGMDLEGLMQVISGQPQEESTEFQIGGMT